jgi:hypothetical protein
MTAKPTIIGESIPNLPWEERPAGCTDVMWRHSRNPVIPKNPMPGFQGIYNSAVMALEGGFIGVFRTESKSRFPFLHLGRSRDGLNWEIERERIELVSDDPEVGDLSYAYDPRLCKIDDTYYITWCGGHNGPTISIASTADFKTFRQLENAFLPFNRNGVLFPRKVNGSFLMLSRPSDDGHTPFGDIFLSRSPDMCHWGAHRRVMGRGGGEHGQWWQRTKIGAGPIPIETTEQMGATVTRQYTLSVRKQGESPSLPRHVLGPGQFNEEAFRALDKVLELANEIGVRIIIPFVDNWSWWGGTAEYAAFRGKRQRNLRDAGDPENAFWHDRQLIEDFKTTIRHVVNRRNHYTGIRYRDDKAILAWETGNELHSPPAWTREITAYIKTLDRNHLVLDGFHTRVLRAETIDDPNVDLVSTHHYEGDPQKMVANIDASLAKLRGRKPYFLGEFGFIPTSGVRRVLDAVIREGLSGALIWSLRYHSRDGGYYWHSEPMGGDKYKAYHWPGFPEGEKYDEIKLMGLMREKGFEIRGLQVPAVPAPQAPHLLPISSPAAISWRGSAGARAYDVARATAAAGPWAVVARDVSDNAVQYRPLFHDRTAAIGKTYYYRVIARNESGVSPPSDPVGPVEVRSAALVDEMRDGSQMHGRRGTLAFRSDRARKTKEDQHRLAGEKGSSITYRTQGPISSCILDAYFPKEVADFRFSASADGESFTEVPAAKESFYAGAGKYEYFKPVRYRVRQPAQELGQPARFLRIEFGTDAQISRVEIYFGK